FRLPILVRGKRADGVTKDVTVLMDSIQTTTVDAQFGFMPESLTFDPDGILLMKVVRATKLDVTDEPSSLPSGLKLQIYSAPNHHFRIVVSSAKPLGALHMHLADLAGRIVRSADTLSFANRWDYMLDL